MTRRILRDWLRGSRCLSLLRFRNGDSHQAEGWQSPRLAPAEPVGLEGFEFRVSSFEYEEVGRNSEKAYCVSSNDSKPETRNP